MTFGTGALRRSRVTESGREDVERRRLFGREGKRRRVELRRGGRNGKLDLDGRGGGSRGEA